MNPNIRIQRARQKRVPLLLGVSPKMTNAIPGEPFVS